MTTPEFNRMITVSMAHISKETDAALADACRGDVDLPEMTVYEKNLHGHDPVGYFVYLCVKPEQIDTEKLPEDLAGLVNLARFCGASMICLDGDGPVVEGLPTYWQDYED